MLAILLSRDEVCSRPCMLSAAGRRCRLTYFAVSDGPREPAGITPNRPGGLERKGILAIPHPWLTQWTRPRAPELRPLLR